MKLLLMGAGALGSVVGGFMAKAGHAVTLVGRAAHMDAIARDGLRITGIWGEHRVGNLVTRTTPDGLPMDTFDFVLITVKSYDTREAIGVVREFVGPRTLVVSYQNGLGNAEIIAEAVGWERTVGARAIYGAWIPEAGRVEVTVIAEPTALGVYDRDTPVEAVLELVAAMDFSGLPTVFTDRIATVLWSKVAYNCALNPLSALLDVPYGRLFDTEDTRAIMREVIEELYAVADAMNVPMEPRAAHEYERRLFEVLIPPTAQHYGSMREDFRRRRRTEIEALNGAICRYGAAHGVKTPVNELLTRLVRARSTENIGVRP